MLVFFAELARQEIPLLAMLNSRHCFAGTEARCARLGAGTRQRREAPAGGVEGLCGGSPKLLCRVVSLASFCRRFNHPRVSSRRAPFLCSRPSNALVCSCRARCSHRDSGKPTLAEVQPSAQIRLAQCLSYSSKRGFHYPGSFFLTPCSCRADRCIRLQRWREGSSRAALGGGSLSSSSARQGERGGESKALRLAGRGG